MPTRQEIAARIKALRLEKGSHDKLAAALGKPLTRQAVIRHERTGRMKPVTARRYAKLTGTAAEDWLPEGEVVEVPLELFVTLVDRLEQIAVRLERLADQGPRQSG